MLLRGYVLGHQELSTRVCTSVGTKCLIILFSPFQWNLIDEATGETGSHSDLSALSKEHTQVFTMSMWDIPRKFRQVAGVCSDPPAVLYGPVPKDISLSSQELM